MELSPVEVRAHPAVGVTEVKRGGHEDPGQGWWSTSQNYAIRQSIAEALVAYYQKFVDEQRKKEIKDIFVRYDRTPLVADQVSDCSLNSALWMSKEGHPENWHVQVFRSIDSGSLRGFPKTVQLAKAQITMSAVREWAAFQDDKLLQAVAVNNLYRQMENGNADDCTYYYLGYSRQQPMIRFYR